MAPNPRRGPPSSNPQARAVQVSKALSWLLRHGAAKERIPIDTAGYVNLQDVLKWQKLKALAASFEEVIDVVQSNEKQRFGLRWDGIENPGQGQDDDVHGQLQPTPHQLALAHLASTPNPDARDYSIRAVQGHSLKTIEQDSLLMPITLANVPETCVHGTFFVAWPVILKSGGLKSMTRNHVHFASRPRAEDVLPEQADGQGRNMDLNLDLKSAMQRNQVTSGMRLDAQVLIYVDVRRALGNGMEWWRSDNGVILTEGVVPSERDGAPPSELEETALMLESTSVIGEEGVGGVTGQADGKKKHDGRRSQRPTPAPKLQRCVPMEYWDVVVGIGLGVLWQRGKGVVQEVPADLMKGGKGKFAQNRHANNGTGKGNARSKPKMKVEKDDLEGLD